MTDFNGNIYVQRTAQSTSIDYNNGIITQALLTATEDYGAFQYFLTADGGLHWEEVISGVVHTFTNTGTDLRWQILGSGRLTQLVISGYH